MIKTDVMVSHDKIVKRISETIKSAVSTGRTVSIVKDTVSHMVPNPYEDESKLLKLDISGLTRVLSIDPVERTCVAESGVSFSDLTRETLKHNLIPITIPELRHITIGGAVAGGSVESMSYKYGSFHDNCLEHEVVLGSGEIVTCSAKQNPDIFKVLQGSYGTIGIITKLKFRLLPAKPYVHMQYVTHRTFDDFLKELMERCESRKDDFIDAIIHSNNCFVICIGNMVEDAPYLSDYKWLKVFYKTTRDRTEDYLTTCDYFFRYDADCHWVTKTLPFMETVPARFALGKFILGSTNLLKWAKRIKPLMRLKLRPDVVVDVFIHAQRFKEFYEWFKRDFSFYPLWIVPFKSPDFYWFNRDYTKVLPDSFWIDIAIYGKNNNEKDIDYSELLEKKVLELNGWKTLISRNHYSREEFWRIYDKQFYDKMKSICDPHHFFRDLYDHFHPEASSC